MDQLPEDLEAARQRISQLEQELKQAQEDAKEAIAELQFFVYAASHDLQQPLRAIGTHAQLLQRLFPNDQTAREFTQVVVDNAAQMNGLITDLLTYSRAGTNFQAKPVNLNAPLQWALYTLSKHVAGARAGVTSGDLPEVSGDEKQLATVFEQLISNALKFGGTNPPAIHVSAAEDDRAITVSVQDNGPGIKPEYLERIFDPFKRLHGKEIPGSGLGLSICRKILRAHRGKIWMESDGDSGSTAKFSLPL